MFRLQGGEWVARDVVHDVQSGGPSLFLNTRDIGHVDILVNNAATFVFHPAVETTEEEFDRVFALNTRGAFFAMQEAARVLPDRARIINISTGGTTVGLPDDFV